MLFSVAQTGEQPRCQPVNKKYQPSSKPDARQNIYWFNKINFHISHRSFFWHWIGGDRYILVDLLARENNVYHSTTPVYHHISTLLFLEFLTLICSGEIVAPVPYIEHAEHKREEHSGKHINLLCLELEVCHPQQQLGTVKQHQWLAGIWRSYTRFLRCTPKHRLV